MFSTPTRALLVAVGSMLALNACNADQANKSAADKPAATVNGTAIKQSTIDAFIQQRAAQGAPDTPEMRKALLEELISREVVRQAALKEGIDKKPEVQMQLDLAQQNILLGAYVQNYAKSHPITDDMIKAEYDKLKTQIGDKQYRARHILVADKKEAAEVTIRLSQPTRSKDILSLSGAGKVAEYRLQYKVGMAVLNARGEELLAGSEVQLVRDLSYDDKYILAKEYEEALLFQAMEQEVLQTLLRRLRFAKGGMTQQQ